MIAIDRHGDVNWNQPSKPRNITMLENNSILSIYFALLAHGPLYASYGNYNAEGERTGGHAVVVTGIDLINHRVFTNNPWGITGEQDYQEFLNIFLGENDSGYRLDNCYYFN